jgi:ribosome-associated heat shock protein Hsp15
MDEVRIDRWLWAARCFKTRSNATRACQAGHVQVDGVNVRASKKVTAGMTVDVLTAGGPRNLEIVALAERRGSATVAQTLFVDHTPPPPAKPEPSPNDRPPGAGRPTKRERRRMPNRKDW